MITRFPPLRLALAAVILPGAALAAPQNINTCQAISQPGAYIVNRNLAASGDCLVVAADFVTIDLDGFVLTGTGTGAGVAVGPGPARRGLTVRNGTVVGFSMGIDAANAVGTNVERVTATGNASVGINTGDRAIVTRSHALNNGGDGIRGGRGATIAGNVVGDNQNGIFADSGSSVLHNISRNNRAHGVVMDCPGLFMGNASSNSGTVVVGSQNFHDISGGCVENVHNAAGPNPPPD
jgi:hypothetical protein